MNKAERLLDLIAFLLNAREPVSFDEITQSFPDEYGGGSQEAIARKFERDKAEIIELGLPLIYVSEDSDDKGGYSIDRDVYSLNRLSLDSEELALLFFAGSATLDLEGSPFTQDLILALNKIAFATSEQGHTEQWFPRGLPVFQQKGNDGALRRKEHLQILHRAIIDRKQLTLTYHGFWRDEITQRRVDPYGLVNRKGTWIMAGYCHLRKSIRTFHLDRIRELAVNPLKPKTPDFETPRGFKLCDVVSQEPWQVRAHPPVTVVLRFEPPVAELAVKELGLLETGVEKEGEALKVSLEVTCLDGLLPTILWYREKVHVLSPPELVTRVTDALKKIAAVPP